MPNIKPISDLRNYNELLRDISEEEPIFLTRNGRGCYVLQDIKEYERHQAIIKLFSKLVKSEESAREKGWISQEDVERELGI